MFVWFQSMIWKYTELWIALHRNSWLQGVLQHLKGYQMYYNSHWKYWFNMLDYDVQHSLRAWCRGHLYYAFVFHLQFVIHFENFSSDRYIKRKQMFGENHKNASNIEWVNFIKIQINDNYSYFFQNSIIGKNPEKY